MANFRQKSVEDWQAPYETNVGKLAKAHPIANVIGLGIPALVQSAAGGVGNAASLMATPDTRPAARRIEDAVQGSNFVTGIKAATTPSPDSVQVPISPIIPAAQAATKALVPSIESTPMLPSHTPDTGAPVPTADQATQNAWDQAQKKRWPLTNATSKVPVIDQTGGQPGGGIMSIEGGGSASVDSQGNIVRGIDWNPGGGGLTVVPAAQMESMWNKAGESRNVPAIEAAPKVNTPIMEQAQDAFGRGKVDENGQPIMFQRAKDITATVGPIGPDKAAEAVRAKFGFLPDDYYKNPTRYQNLLAASAVDLRGQADMLSAQNQIPVANIGLEGHKYVAEQGLAGHKALAGAEVEKAGIMADANKKSAAASAMLKAAEEQSKDRKDIVKTFYDNIKNLNLPAGWEGKHMELAKIMAQNADPNIDLGIYYSPGSNRQGIAAKKTVFEPLLTKYRNAGYPEADAYANAYRDLQELEKQEGANFHQPFPNLDRLVTNTRKPDETMGIQ